MFHREEGQNRGQETALPSAEKSCEELQRVLSSRLFSGSERLSHFLRYVVEETLAGRGGAIKEYTIATEVYGRSAGYDPKTDAIVRVEAGRLRSKLETYYRTEGARDPIRIELPRGGYVPVFAALAGDTTGPADVAPRHRARPWQVAAITIILGVFIFAVWWRSRQAGTQAPLLSIAVLPLTSPPGDTAAARFADTFSHQIASALMGEGAFSVTGPAPANRTKPLSSGHDAVQQSLAGDAAIQGTVQSVEAGVRVTVHVVSGRDGHDLWSQSYESLPGWHGNFQDRLSYLIARTLRARFGGFTEEQLQKPPTVHREAMSLYEKGREAWLFQERSQLVTSLDYYRQALEKDPRFAKAYEGIAASELFLATLDPTHADGHVVRAKLAALKALQLDDRLDDAHARLGNIYLRREWNFAFAANELRRSVTLAPGSQPITRWYSEAARLCDHNAFAREELENGLFAHPNGEMILTELGMLDYQMGRFDEAGEEARRSAAIDPSYRLTHLLAGLLHEHALRIADAEAEYKSCSDQSEFGQACIAALGHLYGAQGKAKAALDMTRQLDESVPPVPSFKALVYVALGDTDRAFAELNRAYELRDEWLPLVKLDERFAPLRADSRYGALMNRLGLRPAAQ